MNASYTYMKNLTPLLVLASLILPVMGASAQTPPETAAFTPAAPFQAFLESDIRRLEPQAVIVRPGAYLQLKDRVLVRPDAVGDAKTAYIEVVADWIEPLAAAPSPGEIKVVLAQGTVEAAPAGQPEAFAPVAVGAVIAPGSTVRTGADGQLGLTIGNRSAARFIAGTAGRVDFTPSAGREEVRIELKNGAVFNRINSVNKDVDYQVRTPQAIAAARGTDFVAVALPDVTDVWVAEGTVELLDLQGQSLGRVSADEPGALKIIRSPAAPDAPAEVAANTRTMSVAMSLIPLVNTETNRLRAPGTALTTEQSAYLEGVHRVHYLVKVTRP